MASRVARISLDDIYGQVLRSEVWIKQTYDEICRYADRNGISKQRFTLYRYTNMVYYYYMELINYSDDKENIYSFLIYSIGLKIDIKAQRIAEILTETTKKVNRDNANPSLGEITTIPDKSASGTDMTTIRFGKIPVSVPTYVYERLSNPPFTKDMFYRLILQYQLIGRTKGFFWSIDSDLYKTFPSLDKYTQPLPTLECFASPLNHNLVEYCSVFSEDVHFGSRGNFFDYIKTLKGPYRFIFNPPYTTRIINDGIKVVLEYIDANPGCELISMLPYWRDNEGIEQLTATSNKYIIALSPKDYSIHDFALGEDLLVNVSMIFYVSIGNSEEKSKTYAQSIKKMLKEKADRLSKMLDSESDTILNLPEQVIPEEEAGPLIY